MEMQKTKQKQHLLIINFFKIKKTKKIILDNENSL